MYVCAVSKGLLSATSVEEFDRIYHLKVLGYTDWSMFRAPFYYPHILLCPTCPTLLILLCIVGVALPIVGEPLFIADELAR